MKFPGAVLLSGSGDEADFRYWPVTMANGCTVVGTSAFTYSGTSAVANTGTSTFGSTAGAAPTTLAYTLSPTFGTVTTSTSWYQTPDRPRELVRSVWRGPSKARTLLAELMTSDTKDVAQEPMTSDVANTEAASPEPVPSTVASQPQERIRKFRARRAAVTTKRLTGLAVIIAGERGPAWDDEWWSHLAGESGRGLASSRQARDAARGFLIAALRTRLQDASDLAWRPVDAVLASRELSNLIVMLTTLIVAEISIHGAGLYGLVSNLANIAVAWPAAYGLIRLGRWWRGVKPPEHKPRRSKELAPLGVDTLLSNYAAAITR